MTTTTYCLLPKNLPPKDEVHYDCNETWTLYLWGQPGRCATFLVEKKSAASSEFLCAFAIGHDLGQPFPLPPDTLERVLTTHSHRQLQLWRSCLSVQGGFLYCHHFPKLDLVLVNVVPHYGVTVILPTWLSAAGIDVTDHDAFMLGNLVAHGRPHLPVTPAVLPTSPAPVLL